MTMLSDISTRDELATLLGIKVSTLTYVLYKVKVDSFYTSFEIPKKNGGRRQIDAPTGTLKFIQERIAFILRKHQAALQSSQNTRTNISHAFERGKSIQAIRFLTNEDPCFLLQDGFLSYVRR